MLLDDGFVGLLKGFLEPLPTAKRATNGEHALALPHAQVSMFAFARLAEAELHLQTTFIMHGCLL